MRPQISAIAAVLVLAALAQGAGAEGVPEWVKNNAGWWADGTISESEFVSAMQYLVREGILVLPPTEASDQQSGGIPDWVKNTAAWWSQGLISDADFVSGIQYLASVGIIAIAPAEGGAGQQAGAPGGPGGGDLELERLRADLEACSEIRKAYDRLNCERDAEGAITAHDYRANGEEIRAGPVTFYYKGNDFEITPSGQALLEISMLAENNGPDTVTLMCTGPSICNYDVWNGDKAFKYSGTDFVNGAIVLDPGVYREFSMLFGPNIGYGGTTFEYDAGKDYFFRILEPWGSASIPLDLG